MDKIVKMVDKIMNKDEHDETADLSSLTIESAIQILDQNKIEEKRPESKPFLPNIG